MDCFCHFSLKIFTNLSTMSWHIWYFNCQICISECVLLFKPLYNDRISWAVCAMGTNLVFFVLQFRDLDLLDMNSSTFPKIHECKCSVNWEKNFRRRVNFTVVCVIWYYITRRLIIVEQIIIAASMVIKLFWLLHYSTLSVCSLCWEIILFSWLNLNKLTPYKHYLIL